MTTKVSLTIPKMIMEKIEPEDYVDIKHEPLEAELTSGPLDRIESIKGKVSE